MPLALPPEATEPSPLDLTARYERLRSSVLRDLPDSYEAAVVVHRGLPGWVDFTRRLGVGHAPPEQPHADATTDGDRRPAVALPCRRELVKVLASVVLHCLESTP